MHRTLPFDLETKETLKFLKEYGFNFEQSKDIILEIEDEFLNDDLIGGNTPIKIVKSYQTVFGLPFPKGELK